MSKNQYEWLLALAKMWRSSQQDDQAAAAPMMERVDGVLGKLTPTGWSPANETILKRMLLASGEDSLVNMVQGAIVKFNFLCKLAAFFERNSLEKCKTRITSIFPANLGAMRVSALFATFVQSSIPSTPPHVQMRAGCLY